MYLPAEAVQRGRSHDIFKEAQEAHENGVTYKEVSGGQISKRGRQTYHIGSCRPLEGLWVLP